MILSISNLLFDFLMMLAIIFLMSLNYLLQEKATKAASKKQPIAVPKSKAAVPSVKKGKPASSSESGSSDSDSDEDEVSI